LVNHPLRGDVTGIPISQNPDTPGLSTSSKNSIKPERILAELSRSSYSNTPNKLRCATTLKTSPLSLLYKNELGSTIGGLNLTLFTLSVEGGTMVFIGGVRWCCGRRLGAWGLLVKPTIHATWTGGQVSSLHHLWALDTLSTTSAGHIDKTVFGNAPTHSRPAKVMWPAGHTMDQLSPCFVPCHFLMSNYL
jgi:hypothetical protein